MPITRKISLILMQYKEVHGTFFKGDINYRIVLESAFDLYKIDKVLHFVAESHMDCSIPSRKLSKKPTSLLLSLIWMLHDALGLDAMMSYSMTCLLTRCLDL